MAQALVMPERVVLYNRNPYKFIVIGCGGTGSYFVRDLFRIVGVYNRQFNRNDTILLVDGDKVEDKNLARQNFVISDIGKNKAQVLSARYGNAFGVESSFLPEYLRQDNGRMLMEASNGSVPILIGCVDNNKTRHLIHELYRANGSNGTVYLDSGNEEYAGQVVFSCNAGYTNNGYAVSFFNGHPGVGIKDAVELFDMKPDDRHPDELSCADRAVSAPQNIATNIMAANVLFGYCNAILHASCSIGSINQRNPVELADKFKEARGITAHVTYFNSRTGTQSSQMFDDAVTQAIKIARESREKWVARERERLSLPL